MWPKVKAFFKDSETIFFARLQAFVGAMMLVITAVDPSLFAAYLPEKYVPLWLIFAGVVTEIARRRREKDWR